MFKRSCLPSQNPVLTSMAHWAGAAGQQCCTFTDRTLLLCFPHHALPPFSATCKTNRAANFTTNYSTSTRSPLRAQQIPSPTLPCPHSGSPLLRGGCQFTLNIGSTLHLGVLFFFILNQRWEKSFDLKIQYNIALTVGALRVQKRLRE